MSFDLTSYILGISKGGGDKTVIIEGDINCTDDGNGNVTIEEENNGE